MKNATVNLVWAGMVAGIINSSALAATFDVGIGDIGFKAGDWDISLAGEVNGFYSISDCDSPAATVGGGLSCTGGTTSDIRNGLLPAAFIISAATTQSDFDIGFTFGFFPGINNRVDGGVNGVNNNVALGTAGTDFRLTYLTFGQESWGNFLIGRNIGIFGRDAILLDQTIAGVGGNLGAPTPPNTSLGRIGVGYIYADFQPQITYTTPNISGFQASIGVFQPLDSISFAADAGAPLSGTATEHTEPQFQGGLSFARSDLFGGQGDIKLWTGTVYQKQGAENNTQQGHTGRAYEFGAKAGFENAELVGYYYFGDGIGTTGYFFDSVDPNGNTRDSDGFYVQGSYNLFQKAKLAVSYGQSNLDRAGGEARSSLIKTNESFIYGLYYHLTKSLQLVAEYTDQESEAHNGNKDEENTLSLGAVLFF